MPKITPFLWFDTQAEEAAKFYVSVFKNGKILEVSRYPEGSPYPPGSVMAVTFQLENQRFYALNGGPHMKINAAISMFVDCDTQDEVDTLWDKLLEGGQAQQCGWLTDKFGLTWQIVPTMLMKYMTDPDKAKSGRTMAAMMKMVKLDLNVLKRAYEGT